ncbi:MAG: lysophospholipid acyltransferase family protein [Planctomycetes bacterium]|nr:lysophospholipid acyltransferase family protein [Planctomycetota bacterium]
MENARNTEPFSLPNMLQGGLGTLSRLLRRPLERALGLREMNAVFREVRRHGGRDSFAEKALEVLSIACAVSRSELEKIPREGPVLVVANHPFGMVDGLALVTMLRRVRPDARVLGNSLLRCVPELDEFLIYVNPFGGGKAHRENIAPLRAALRHLQGGGCLGMFPAGEVARLRMRRGGVTEGAWDDALARLAQASGATLVPIFIEGRNSRAFQVAGLLHPRLSTALLGRELLNKRGRTIRAAVGSPIKADQRPELAQELRRRTLALEGRLAGHYADHDTNDEAQAPIAAETNPALLRAELQSLLPNARLAGSGNFEVFCFRAAEAPNLLREIGRLREYSYRQNHEGTGRPLDLDEFDRSYLHLMVWDREAGRIAGAYRLGQTDEILPRRGLTGLYTSTLFRMSPRLMHQVDPALELGRSWVHPDYQRSFAPLNLLWKGIAAYVAANPRYRRLFGPVSINNHYNSVSRELMIAFLREHTACPELDNLVRARRPHRAPRNCRRLADAIYSTSIRSIDDVSRLVAEIEADHKGVPILLKQYLKLGAKLLAFNVDPEFGHVLDGLMLVDLATTDERMLERFMGEQQAARFLQVHGRLPAPASDPALTPHPAR